MISLINKILFYIKVVLALVAFCFILYIAFIRNDYLNMSIISILPLFIPFFIILVLLVFNFVFNKASNNLFYNLGSTLAFIAINIISLRTIFDNNIIYLKGSININFFAACEVRIKVLLYLIIIGNVILLYRDLRKIKRIHS